MTVDRNSEWKYSFKHTDGRIITLTYQGEVIVENYDPHCINWPTISAILPFCWKDLVRILVSEEYQAGLGKSTRHGPFFTINSAIRIMIKGDGPDLTLVSLSDGLLHTRLVLELPIDQKVLKDWLDHLTRSHGLVHRALGWFRNNGGFRVDGSTNIVAVDPEVEDPDLLEYLHSCGPAYIYEVNGHIIVHDPLRSVFMVWKKGSDPVGALTFKTLEELKLHFSPVRETWR